MVNYNEKYIKEHEMKNNLPVLPEITALCPWCESRGSLRAITSRDTGGWSCRTSKVVCENCGAAGPYAKENEDIDSPSLGERLQDISAINKWNAIGNNTSRGE